MMKFFLFNTWMYPKNSVVMVTRENAFKPSYRGKYVVRFNGEIDERSIIRKLGIDSSQYRKVMKSQFNAKQIDDEHFMYKDINDARGALEWMESMLVMNKIAENEPDEWWYP